MIWECRSSRHYRCPHGTLKEDSCTFHTISDQLIRPGMEQAKTPSELRTSVVNYLDNLRDNPVTSDAGVHLKFKDPNYQAWDS